MKYPDAAPGQTVVLQGQLTYGAVAQGGRTLRQTGGTLLVSKHATTGQSRYPIFLYSGYGGPGSEGRLVVAGVLTNNSTIDVRGGQTGLGFPGAGAEVLIEGTLHNSGEVFLYGGGVDRGYSFAGTGATLINTGVLTNSGNIYLEAGWPSNRYSNSGALLIDAGVLSNKGSIGVAAAFESGALSGMQPSTLSVSGSLTNFGTLTAHGGLQTGIGGQIDVAGSLSNSGVIDLAGGGTDTGDSGATLALSGVLHNHGQIQIGGGGSYGTSFEPGATLLDRGILTNSGTIAFYERPGYGPTGMLEITSAGVLQNDGTIAGLGTIANYGLINSGATPSGPNLLDARQLINSGVIEVLPGATTQIDGYVRQSIGGYTHFGSLYIDSNATLAVSSSVYSQVVVFNGKNADLSISNLNHFLGDLDFAKAQPSVIDLVGQQIISAQITPNNYFGHYLSITSASGGSHNFYIVSNSQLPSVSLQNDGHGGTDLLFTPAADGAFLSLSQHGILSDIPRPSTSSMTDVHPF